MRESPNGLNAIGSAGRKHLLRFRGMRSLRRRRAVYYLLIISLVVALVSTLLENVMDAMLPNTRSWLIWDTFLWTWIASLVFGAFLQLYFARQQIHRAMMTRRIAQQRRELLRAKRELERINEMKTAFLGMASHDLRTPLMAIQLSADLVQQQASREHCDSVAGALSRISEATLKMRVMLDNYLDYTRIESGGFSATPAITDMCDWAHKITDVLRPIGTARQIDLELSCREQIRARIDASILELAVVNVITNAIKFSPENGKVLFKVEDRDGDLRMAVTDQGPGVGTNTAHLFEKFFQEPAAVNEKNKGVGLGLYIARMAVQAHGGTISASPRAPKGSVFEIVIPAACRAAHAAA